ncbi:hypothetical protein [Yinghuangia seranimata]|uniref:COG1470 family protein n=1 Tax=Yinghuangia seranimata TaxID=408067 RepID=UPI00248AB680|nr:hypothetical protein [Yinghuangia seranimata]MDI2125248.1 hypothetical protein [Yinghuangia seranimata]
MTTSAHLEPALSTLLPGQEARVEVTLRNGSDVVEAYRFEVLGAAGEWTAVEPETLSLYPDTSGSVTLVMRPPRDARVPSGDVPYGVRVLPQERRETATVPEGVLRIEPFTDLTAEITPRLGTFRRRKRLKVAVDNRGNAPAKVRLVVPAGSELLTVKVPSEPLPVAPGAAVFVPVTVTAKRRVWRGAPVSHAVRIAAQPDAGEPVNLDATCMQLPMLPAGAGKALIAALVAAGLLAVAWFALLKPAVHSAAKNAVKQDVQTAKDQAAGAQQKAANAQNAAAAAQEQAAEGAKAGSAGAAAAAAAASPSAAAPVLFSQRLKATAAAGAGGKESYTVPAGKTLRLTDLVLENPQGDSGTVTLTIGDRVVVAPALENFREQDFHWSSPIQATEKQTVTVTVNCQQVGKPAVGAAPTSCVAAAFFSGTLG